MTSYDHYLDYVENATADLRSNWTSIEQAGIYFVDDLPDQWADPAALKAPKSWKAMERKARRALAASKAKPKGLEGRDRWAEDDYACPVEDSASDYRPIVGWCQWQDLRSKFGTKAERSGE